MKLFKFLVLSSLILALVGFSGCSDDDDDNPVAPGEQGESEDLSTILQIDATSSATYTYVNLESMNVVYLTDEEAEASNDWHVAFSRIYGKVNGGDAGSLGVKAVDLAELEHEYGSDYLMVTELPEIAEDQWQEDEINLVMNGWYDYDGNTHQIVVTEEIYVIHTVEGNYAKFMVDGLRDASMPPNMGYLNLRYVYQPDGSTDLSGDEQTIEIDGTSGNVCFSFAQGAVVEVDDPATSSEWDIMFDAYDLMMNCQLFGPGSVSVYPMYLETDDFASVTSAPTGGGYFSDAIASIFGSPTVEGSEWYDYDSEVHEITSKGHVYILSLPSDKYFKLDITNYYKVIEGTPTSGWPVLRFREL